MPADAKPLLLVISQVYVPDPASVGQYMADVAETMAARGVDVRVLTSACGYENPTHTYPRREWRGGVDVRRLPWSSFGKRTLFHRLLGQSLFLVQVILRGVFARRLSAIVVSTSPPMASLAALAIGTLRRVPITYWLMDLNPDQAIALGEVDARSLLAKALRWLNRRIFARAAQVIVLDRYMAERVERQYRVRGRMEILPPWPQHASRADVAPADNPFRREHNRTGRFVVMYSGNHSPASPVTTLVEAALRMRHDRRFLFLFVGGGSGKREVEEAIARHRPANIVSLPYEPLDRLPFSLAAADLHVVTLGTAMVGMVHPSKIYGAMGAGRPVMLIGPRPSQAAALIERYEIGWQADSGEVERVVAAIRQAAELPADARAAIGRRARAAIRDHFSKDRLCGLFCDLVETTIEPSRAAAAAPAGIA